MSAQGWSPGKLLGKPNAAHSDHFTPGSTSHVRAILKDDTLGLGARPKAQNESTGLDAFQGLLGRLNGKSDAQLEEEQRRIDEQKMASYVDRKWKTMNFVSGGLLAHEKSNDQQKNRDEEDANINESDKKEISKGSKGKRKKDGSGKEATGKEENTPTINSKPSKSTDIVTSTTSSESEEKRKKKSKKRKRKLESYKSGQKEPEVLQKDGAQAVLGTMQAKEHRPLGRHAIRGRQIQHKKMALLDEKSLNEVSSPVFQLQNLMINI